MMKFVLVILLSPFVIFAQTSREYAVLLSAEVKKNPPSIKLYWPAETATSHFVYRKMKADASFSSSFVLLSGSDSSYTDTTVEIGKSYEYYVKRNGSVGAYGYINTGIKVNSETNGLEVKGKLILLIDSTHSQTLISEIDGLIQILESECWTVIRHDVSPSASVPAVKQLIVSEYQKDPQNVKAVYLFGHIPVPYSGNLAPDAHPDHVGAWPADAYYGDMDGIWTDVSVNDTSASDPRNKNIPGDGKFDASVLPSAVELQVGRVDFANMPLFALSESELLRQYLNKSLDFRIGKIKVEERGIIDDNFGGFSNEAFAASAWKAFSTFFGADSITFANSGTSHDYRTNLNQASYLWSYGCGGGSYTSASGIGNSTQLAGDSLQTVFTALFGSYFGDWDKTNNFLRAPLAQGLTLTNAWSGRPHWYFHHMALGENIGYSQNIMVNTNPYYQHYGARFVHIALMGDPSLTMHIVEPPTLLSLTETSNTVELTWNASPDNILGYHIFRKDSVNGLYHRVNNDIINSTSYIDTEFDKPDRYWYTVRAVKLEQKFSGSYYNLSSGATGFIDTQYTGSEDFSSEIVLQIYPNPAKDNLNIHISDFTGNLKIELVSTDGRILLSENYNNLRTSKNLN